ATLAFPARTFRYFRLLAGAKPPTYTYVPSNSNTTGTTSGWPPAETVATRASRWGCREATSSSLKDTRALLILAPGDRRALLVTPTDIGRQTPSTSERG